MKKVFICLSVLLPTLSWSQESGAPRPSPQTQQPKPYVVIGESSNTTHHVTTRHPREPLPVQEDLTLTGEGQAIMSFSNGNSLVRRDEIDSEYPGIVLWNADNASKYCKKVLERKTKKSGPCSDQALAQFQDTWVLVHE